MELMGLEGNPESRLRCLTGAFIIPLPGPSFGHSEAGGYAVLLRMQIRQTSHEPYGKVTAKYECPINERCLSPVCGQSD